MMASGYGHLYPTFKLASRLQEEGYHIIYGVPESFADLINELGFHSVIMDPQLYTLGNGARINGKGYWENLLHRIADRISNVHLRYTSDKMKKMNRVIDQVRPHILFIDAIISYNYFLLDYKPQCIISLQTMLDTKRRRGLPPLNSSLLPNEYGWFSEFSVKVCWAKHLWSRRLKQWLSFGDSITGVTSRILKKTGLILKDHLDENTAFRPRIKNLREVVIAPKSFDLSDISPTQQAYLASTVYDSRVKLQRAGVEDFYTFLSELKNIRKIVYCSFGTLNVTHNQNCKRLFQEIIDLFATKPDWHLVLATGEMRVGELNVKSTNVSVFERVNQLEVLSRSDVMITHAGLNSVLECIHYSVPMLAYPLSRKWDQPGNTVRLLHYGLGLSGDIRRDRVKEVQEKLEALMSEKKYQANFKKMNTNINKEVGLDDFIDSLRNIDLQGFIMHDDKRKHVLV